MPGQNKMHIAKNIAAWSFGPDTGPRKLQILRFVDSLPHTNIECRITVETQIRSATASLPLSDKFAHSCSFVPPICGSDEDDFLS